MKNFFTRFSAAVCFLFVSNGYSTDLSDVEHEAVTIWSGGIRLQGDIFKPAEIPAGEKLPGILLVHGRGGYKQHLNRNYAPQFAKLGFVVITFDYKGWGESNGRLLSTEPLDKTDEFLARVNVDVTHVRKIVNPLSMVEDARAALNYLAGEKQVAANNIGIWGTSLGGGVALVTAANDDRIKAYVDQIGAVNFKANLQMINRDMVRRWQVQRARGVIPPYPEADAIINPQLKGYPDWIAMKAFDSLAEAEKLAVPTLIIDAEDEELFAREKNGKVLYEKIKNRVATKYVVYPGKHYDIYRDEAYQGALRDAQQWFVEHLKGSDVGANLYKASCASCHSNPQIKAPALGSLRSLSYDKVLHEITSGNMQQQAAHLTTGEHQQLAKYLSAESKNPRAWEIPMACTNTQAVSVTKTPVANWGYGLRNHRYQNSEQAGLSAEDLNTLEVAWVQGFPGTTEMRSQPVISDNTLFLAVDSTQSVYAFDLAQGCLQWVYRVGAPPRSALSLSRLSNSDKPVIYFGDSGANVHVVDAISGERIWVIPIR